MPVSSLLQSRKFWIMIFDLVTSMVIYFAAKYAAPVIAEDIKFVLAALQLPVALVIGSIAYEDGQAMKAGITTAQRMER